MNSEILIYTNPEGNIKLDVRLEDETVWLTQEQMGTLFGRAKSTQATQFRIWATKRLKECRVLMPPAASLLINDTKLLKNLLLCSKVLYLCTTNATRAFCISCKSASFLDCYLTKDNTPSRLTSVAHLGGLLFYKPLAL